MANQKLTEQEIQAALVSSILLRPKLWLSSRRQCFDEVNIKS